MKTIFTCSLMLVVTLLSGQNFWNSIEDENELQTRSFKERLIIPEAYEAFNLDIINMQQALTKAPMIGTSRTGVKIALPMADGKMEVFEFFESPAMSPVLSAKYPHIKSYKGASLDNPRNSAWIDYDRTEFRGLINANNSRTYIDPYFDTADGNYIVYDKSAYKVDLEGLEKTCGVTSYENSFGESAKPEGVFLSKEELGTGIESRSAGMAVTKLTYRFALASTGRWTMQQGGTVDAVLSRMNTGVNRINSLFEPELALKLELIDDNDKLIFFPRGSGLSPETPYNDEFNGRPTLAQNTTVINANIGFDNYDMGHVFNGSCSDGIAGVANRASVCNQSKGQGLSCVGNRNLSDFMVSTTAHELGHQFDCGHTWGNCPPSEGQFASDHNCEPGSGSTIMSYFGLCGGGNNLSGDEVPYYHTCSLEPIERFLTIGSGRTCGERVESSNSLPDVWILDRDGATLPISTPFELRGDAMDMDGDPLTFVWEQIDGESFATPLGSPAGNAPLFRSFAPNDQKTRIFPKLSNVLNGLDNAEERLPTYTREMNFSFVARDNNLEAGGTNWATIGFQVTEEAGPFRVTEPSTFTSAEVNGEVLVEWDVANTDGPEVDCQFVDIFFSADNAQTFPVVLAFATPNDGSEIVRMPNLLTNDGKIKVKGRDNVFFNISRNIVRVQEPSAPSFTFEADEYFHEFCLPQVVEIELNGTAFAGYTNDMTLDVVDGLPATATYNFSQNPIPPNGSSTLTVNLDDVQFGGQYPVVIRAVGLDSDTIFKTVYFSTKGSYMEDLRLDFPADQQKGLKELEEFTWTPAVNASGYTIQLSNSPDFSAENILDEKFVGLNTTASDLQFNLENSELYYWRIIAENDCTGAYISPTSIFSAQALTCKEYVSDDVPKSISSGATSTVDIEIDVPEQGTISDVNVELVRGRHDELETVRGSLVSPEGTVVVLWQGGCGTSVSIDAGFDSNSNFQNDCPDKNGLKIRPFGDLADFNEEDIEGKWLLRMFDGKDGAGGLIDRFELQLCASTSLFSPVIINNEVLEVAPSKGAIIKVGALLAEDENNTAEDLKYTMITEPSKGTVQRNGAALTIGSTFTQANINSGLITYMHTGSEQEEDSFIFIVDDGEGGWVNKTQYLINVVDGGLSDAVSDIEDADTYFDIFPNPAKEILNINSKSDIQGNWNVKLMTLDGKEILSQQMNNNLTLDVTAASAGMYMLYMESNGIKASKKVTIIK